jgi:Na+/H+ antiporter NhaB
MATYITVFLSELLVAYILWFVLRKAPKSAKLYRLTIICLVVSLAVGYTASYRMVGYQVTMEYLTAINHQRIEETGRGITLQEENELKEALFQNKEFRKLLATSSIKLSLFPFILVVFIMLFLAGRGTRDLSPEKTQPPNGTRGNTGRNG